MRNRDKWPPDVAGAGPFPARPKSPDVILQMGLPSRFVTLTSAVEPAWTGPVSRWKSELAQHLL
jgi:hypothetical protein